MYKSEKLERFWQCLIAMVALATQGESASQILETRKTRALRLKKADFQALLDKAIAASLVMWQTRKINHFALGQGELVIARTLNWITVKNTVTGGQITILLG